MTLLFIAISFLVFVTLAALNRDQWVAYAIAGFYAFPLYLLTALSSQGYAPNDFQVPANLTNLARAGLHCAVFFIFASFVLLKHHGKLRLPNVAVPAIASCMWLFLVVILADSAYDTAARAMLSLVATVSLFVLIPSITDSSERYLIHIGRATVALALVMTALSVLTIVRFDNFPTYSMRFGRPLNPNVLGYLLLLAFVASGWSRVPLILRAIIGAALVATGSRAATGLAMLFCLMQFVRSYRTWKHVVLIGMPLALIGCIGLYSLPDLLDRTDLALYNRSTIASGRVEAWSNAATAIRENPWLGSAERYYVEDVGPAEKEMRTHNLYIEMAASYGVPMAVLSLLLYVMLWRGTVRASRALNISLAARSWVEWYALAMVVMPLVSTVSWMNLGDGAVILSLSAVLPLLARRGVRTIQHASDVPAPATPGNPLASVS